MDARSEAVPEFIGDLRDGLDAMREVASEQAALGAENDAADLLADTLRVVRHLTTAHSLVASVTAQEEFRTTAKAIEDFAATVPTTLNDTPESMVAAPLRKETGSLATAASAFSPPDPFGYAVAERAAREHVVSAWIRILPDDSRSRLLRPTQDFVAARLPDDLFCLHVILDFGAEAAPAIGASWLPINPEDLDHLNKIQGPVAEALRAGLHDSLTEWQFPTLLRIAERRAACQAMVMSLVKQLSPPVSESDDAEPAEANSQRN